jgi:hypothetical protein
VNAHSIQYRFELEDGSSEVFDLTLDGAGIRLPVRRDRTLPDWTRLDFHQCRHCPLTPDSHSHCPVMADIAGIAVRMDHLISYDEITLEVVTPERTVCRKTTAQRGIGSLLGLVTAHSDCPHTDFLKPMAYFHLPFASEEETIFRAVSSYLLLQYFRQLDGDEPDLELAGLSAMYDNIRIVNRSIIERLRASVDSDSSINGLLILDTFAQAVPDVIGESLDELRGIYAGLLQSDEHPRLARRTPGSLG